MQREREANGRAEQAKLLGGTIPARERSAEAEDARLTALDREIAQGKAAVEEKLRQVEELRRALPFPTRREAEAKIAALRAEEAALQKGIQDAQTRRTNLEKRRAEERGRLETYQAHLRDGEDVDLERAGNRKTEQIGRASCRERV